ncbi:MAG: hypothetical protein O3A81_04940, partial [bacterium]|nr:hypothetical protein [bacterium]
MPKNKHPLQHFFPDIGKEHAVQRSANKVGVSGSNIPLAVDSYLQRMREIFTSPKADSFTETLVENHASVHDKGVESALRLEQKIAREEGHHIDIDQGVREQMKENLNAQTQESFERWLTYLTSSDSDSIPDWQKYYMLRSLLKFGSYDKNKQKFNKRSKETVAPYPELNSEALAMVSEKLTEHFAEKSTQSDTVWDNLIDGGSFGKIYSHAMITVVANASTVEQKEIIKGSWTQFAKGGNGEELKASLEGHNTGWCTAGGTFARDQQKAGDFYVYYTQDTDKKDTIPRIAIRMEQDRIREVRGVGPDQEMEPQMLPVAEQQMSTLPGKESYEKKTADMKHLTSLEKKNTSGEELTKEDMRFLYEFDCTIEGFGYKKDPRIKEIIATRNIKTDLSIVTGFPKSSISVTEQEALKEGVQYHYGNLNLGSLTSAAGLTLPGTVNG